MYKVVKAFIDLQDDNHFYHEGDTFPRDGVIVKDARLKELSTTSNQVGIILIEKLEHVGQVEPVEQEKKTPKKSNKKEK